VINEGSPEKPPGESAEPRRVRKGPDATLSKMSSAIARNREKFSVENLSKTFASSRQTKAN
jgi:hypothetical protein